MSKITKKFASVAASAVGLQVSPKAKKQQSPLPQNHWSCPLKSTIHMRVNTMTRLQALGPQSTFLRHL